MDQSNIAIELIDVDKHFGAVYANDKVNLSVKTGTIHGIVWLLSGRLWAHKSF